jgi:hypothetical protein
MTLSAKERNRLACAKYRAKNLNARRADNRRREAERYAKNPEKMRARRREWRAANPERSRETWSRWMEVPANRIAHNLRHRIKHALKGCAKKSSAKALLSMPLEEFRIYIQGQFRPGMSWENYGLVWELDHIRPCASFDLTDPAQQRECFHWSNHQPLFVAENRSKGAK